jgi:hypothetical protein
MHRAHVEHLEARRFLSTVTATSGAAAGPSAALKITIASPPRGTESVIFTVTYRDVDGVNITSLDNRDLRITGPNRFARYARAISSSANTDGTRRVVRYEMGPPGGFWDAGDNGSYAVRLQGDQVFDLLNNASPAQKLGRFNVQTRKSVGAQPVTRQLARAASSDARIIEQILG